MPTFALVGIILLLGLIAAFVIAGGNRQRPEGQAAAGNTGGNLANRMAYLSAAGHPSELLIEGGNYKATRFDIFEDRGDGHTGFARFDVSGVVPSKAQPVQSLPQQALPQPAQVVQPQNPPQPQVFFVQVPNQPPANHQVIIQPGHQPRYGEFLPEIR